jgi:hypothetical protein
VSGEEGEWGGGRVDTRRASGDEEAGGHDEASGGGGDREFANGASEEEGE